MKKYLSIIFLLLCVVLCLASCDEGNNSQTEPAVTENVEANTSHTHSYSILVTTKNATCTEVGEERRSCSCGDIEKKEIAATGHSYGEWATIKEATCTDVGEESRSCSCGDIEKKEIAATGHSYGEWATIKEATCTDVGEESRSCSCGNAEKREITAKGHSYGEWATIKEATCTDVGEESRSCSCGDTEKKEIAAVGHQWQEATCTDAKTCSVCAVTEGDELGHTTDDGTCERCGEAIKSDESIVADGAYSALSKWLKSQLKNPSSLIVNSVTYSKYESNSNPGEYIFALIINYSAMNGFGGYNRETVLYYCDERMIYQSKDLSTYTIIEVHRLSDQYLNLLNEVL